MSVDLVRLVAQVREVHCANPLYRGCAECGETLPCPTLLLADALVEKQATTIERFEAAVWERHRVLSREHPGVINGELHKLAEQQIRAEWGVQPWTPSEAAPAGGGA